MEITDYTDKFIFDKYLDDKCPVCDNFVDTEDFYSHTENGGKCMAKYFKCKSCHSEYTIGYRRLRHPISSEITFLNKLMKKILITSLSKLTDITNYEECSNYCLENKIDTVINDFMPEPHIEYELCDLKVLIDSVNQLIKEVNDEV